ncbi:Putative ribonuclease H protein At1g65750 [Linum perenne]
MVWRSIHAAQDVIRNGFRWKIGTGSEIKVWNEPWLSRADNRFASSWIADDMPNLKVSDLFLPGSKIWDEQMIEGIFGPEDMHAILQTPLNPDTTSDTRIWGFTKNGQYSVSSGYRVVMETMVDRSHFNKAGNWRAIWDAKVPPRFRVMLWRLARGVLPTRHALYTRGTPINDECGICNSMFENEWHLFLNCEFAKLCWAAVGLRDDIDRLCSGADSFKDWLLHAASTLPDLKFQTIAATLSAIWQERNQRVWEAKVTPHFIVARTAIDMARDWNDMGRAHDNATSNPAPRCDKWHPPHGSVLKCNVDSAIFAAENMYGAGMIIRNSFGDVIAFKTLSSRGCPDPQTCEAHAVRAALLWLEDFTNHDVIIETDSQVVYSALTNEREDLTEFGDIIACCRPLLNPKRLIKHTRRSANEAAHTLARQSRSLDSPTIGETPPTWLSNALRCTCLNTEH